MIWLKNGAFYHPFKNGGYFSLIKFFGLFAIKKIFCIDLTNILIEKSLHSALLPNFTGETFSREFKSVTFRQTYVESARKLFSLNSMIESELAYNYQADQAEKLDRTEKLEIDRLKVSYRYECYNAWAWPMIPYK